MKSIKKILTILMILFASISTVCAQQKENDSIPNKQELFNDLYKFERPVLGKYKFGLTEFGLKNYEYYIRLSEEQGKQLILDDELITELKSQVKDFTDKYASALSRIEVYKEREAEFELQQSELNAKHKYTLKQVKRQRNKAYVIGGVSVTVSLALIILMAGK